MEASTLLVVPKTEICNARCKFCVTKNMYEVDGFEKVKECKIDIKRLEKAIKFSKQLGIRDCNITGGTEPTLENPEILGGITLLLSENFGRVNMYTNGSNLLRKRYKYVDLIGFMAYRGLTNTCISRAHYDDLKNSDAMGMPAYDFEKTVSRLCDENIDSKLSCLLMKEYVGNEKEIKAYIERSKEIGVGKVIFREMLSLKGNEKYETWMKNNYVSVKKVSELMEREEIESFHGLWNQMIWDYDGISVTIWPDGSRKDTINNGDLIYMPDNRLYSSWYTKASRIM